MRDGGFYRMGYRATAAKTQTMRSAWKKAIGVLAIYAVALHVVLTGLVPMGAFARSDDPLSVICHSASAGAVTQQDELPRIPQPGHACEHCNLCTALAPPAAHTALADILVPQKLIRLLRPASSEPSSLLAFDPTLARGPP